MELAELLFRDVELLFQVGPLGFDLALVNRLAGRGRILDGNRKVTLRGSLPRALGEQAAVEGQVSGIALLE